MRLAVLLVVAALTLAGCNANQTPNASARHRLRRRLQSYQIRADKRLLRRPLGNAAGLQTLTSLPSWLQRVWKLPCLSRRR